MSVSPSELKLFQALTMATGFTTANVGGGISTTEILGAVLGEIFFMMSALGSGGGDQLQIQKAFFANTNATDDLTTAKIWLPNALDDGPAGSYPNSAVSSSASDNNTKKVRFLGFDSGSDPVQSELTMNGITEVFDSIPFEPLVSSAELRSVATGLLVTAAGDITLKRNGTVYGVIPAGRSSANSEINIGLAAALDDTDDIADCQTDPSGVTFVRPRTYADGEDVAGGDLLANSGQGIWFKWIQPERRKPTADQQVCVRIRGSSA